MQTIEIIRVSDLATYSQEVTVDVYFDPLFFGCAAWLRQDIGELVVENTYEPPLENYDFPISVGESWEMDYEQATDYSGSVLQTLYTRSFDQTSAERSEHPRS